MKYWIIIISIFFISANTIAQTLQPETQQTKDSTLHIKLDYSNATSKANVPLYIVDGKIKDVAYVNTLDPKSIESVNVLKGDKATKKYGKKGGNGVIIVTIKKDVLLQ